MMQEQTKSFDLPVLDRFVSHCHLRHFPAKTPVVNAGDASNSLFLVITGSVAVIVEDEDGNEIVVAYLNRGEFFGEMGLFADESRRSAWVRTRTECQLAEIGYARFRELAHSDPDLLFELAGQLVARLKRTTRKVSDLAFLDVTGRIARALLDLCLAAGRHDPSGRHADTHQPPGDRPHRGLLPRDGRPRAEVFGRARPHQRRRQDHRGLRRPPRQ